MLCFLIVAADGFDTAAVGFIAPSLVQEWGVAKSALGPVMSAALFGLAIGALTAGPLAVRLGRKLVLTLSVLFFGVWSFASAFAGSIEQLTVLRFLTGLGLGAAMPNAVTMMSEHAPQRIRAIVVNTMLCGFPLGQAVGGFAAAWLIPHHGWHSVLLVGGVVPLLLAVLLMLVLPESVRFMVIHRQSSERIARVLERIAPGQLADVGSFTATEQQAGDGRSALGLVLSARYRLGTLMLWLTYFIGLLIFYLLTSWLPMLFKGVGFSIEKAALITALFPLGGGVGTIFVGWLMGRCNPHRVIAATYALTGALIFAVGLATDNLWLLGVLIFLAGTAMNGAQLSMPTLAAGFYPTQGRATGVAWMPGIGRFGGISGALIGAEMMSLGWGFGTIFNTLAIPALIATVALLIKAGHGRRAEQLALS
ncbi:aromatic acid/H+ symport family MFS transporter [Crenobacter sp. SG2305]|uniref:MFS transporter n=1 Tax=Crenobacter oryzisoli TaxID=3056844 RepID=UPI0025AA9876|nr:aromatic acid/H+ symport family MFS transporter [Crenobacter sp. SG2305]MDN0085475.1 aromatic acid/H+ symport family MFS transporter [Crenobacter sp. SG2305]